MGLKKDADLLLYQELTVPDIILSTCSQNDTSSIGKSKYLVLNIIDSKKEADCPGDADGHELSPYELYHLSKIDCYDSYQKKLGLMVVECERKQYFEKGKT